ncbi:hypothetical protein LCGC14_2798260 [marine sediment metagenome]|uniref:Uncharacterized protein n=1 Tax=marine sediment metagenome TaxID=412755 RepID=A0A0F8YNM1_9ZZZZ
MATTQTDKPTVKITGTTGISGNIDILAIHVISLNGVAGDIVTLQDDGGDDIDSYIVDGSNYDREYVINAKWAGCTVSTNTGNRATVYVKRAHSNMGIGPIRESSQLGA